MTDRKITVEIPAELLERSQRASGTGVTQTVRAGLQLIAASQDYARLLQGERGDDADLLDRALADKLVVMALLVLTEFLSDPKLDASVGQTLAGLPFLELRSGFWERARRLRAVVLAKRRKARLGDALIAQVCVDHQVPLLTRDLDVRAFAETAAPQIV